MFLCSPVSECSHRILPQYHYKSLPSDIHHSPLPQALNTFKMAQRYLVAVAFAALIFSAVAADTGRTLTAATAAPTYDCDGAKLMASVKNGCNLLCGCVGSLNSMYASSFMKNFCISSCNSCNAAAQKCKGKGQPLPQQCSSGSNIKEVKTCINTFLAAQKAGRH